MNIKAYGASASPYFRYFDIRLAKSITLSGQLAIKWISEKVNNDIVNTYKLKKDIYVYSDTDSVVGDSLIKTDKGDITIKDLYDQITNDNLIKNKKDDYVKTVDNIKAYAVDKNKNIKLNNIKYIMKHKVRKKLFKIKCNGNEVTVTEDHSIIVERNEEIISVTPNSINKKTDKIIKIETELKSELKYYDEYEIEELGEVEEWVYDIEVEECHNFFANNILVHNSSYFCLDFVSDSIKKKKDISTKKMVDVIDKFSKKIMEPTIDKYYLELKEYLNCNKQKMIMKQEKISEKHLQTGKKRYACLVWDDEGFRYDKPELKVTGIEIVRSSTPSAIKPFLKESLITLMKHPEDIDNYINNVKEKYYELEPEQIAFPRSVSDVQKYRDVNGNPKKGCPIGVRAGLMYNKYINDNEIDMNEIYDGEKIKFFYTLTPNCFYNQNVFGYINKIPNRDKIIPFVDYNTQFKKSFLTIIEEIGKKVNIEINTKKQTDLEDMF